MYKPNTYKDIIYVACYFLLISFILLPSELQMCEDQIVIHLGQQTAMCLIFIVLVLLIFLPVLKEVKINILMEAIYCSIINSHSDMNKVCVPS